jgi:hypothetical protein
MDAVIKPTTKNGIMVKFVSFRNIKVTKRFSGERTFTAFDDDEARTILYNLSVIIYK